jgi:hypothetical protein
MPSAAPATIDANEIRKIETDDMDGFVAPGAGLFSGYATMAMQTGPRQRFSGPDLP